MIPTDAERIELFITRWQSSSGNERANYQMFFSELCDGLGVARPDAKGSILTDPYCFDKDLKIYHPSGKVTPGYIDFYKAEHFLIEAKQGGNQTGKGTAKRGTNSYLKAMEAAFVQAIAYTRNLNSKPPFVLTCDIGDHFELWTGFNGDYGGYGARRDILLTELRKPDMFDLFVDIFTAPQKRNPEKIAAKVTREVAADLAELSKKLEGLHEPQEVAHFLMRCIFTMFAEDVGLLKERLFTEALETRWLQDPKTFKPEVAALWRAMNDGTTFGFYGRLLKFNGGLFAEATAFDLTKDQLEVMLKAAKRDWQNVEPAIFGTLLERALNSKERSKLGAHYTPRSYVERLVRPVVMEPLRSQWDLVQGEVKQLLGDVEIKPTTAQENKAIAVLEDFLGELRSQRILDPACGSGNFLYVTMDLIKQLESEVLRRLEDITGKVQLRLDITQVNPGQFLGIEINPRAAAIADLVIWIGYLQWHFRQFGGIPPLEPVLREYKNIECRDAVLAYDGKEEDIDPKTGKVKTRWGGRMMKHSVTGESVPDPSDQIPIYRYINARPANWQEADYIVSNPPFIGNARMRDRLSDGYAETLRHVYPDVPETVDFVMYWWHKAAELAGVNQMQRFGFITTNSIHQVRQRGVIEFHQNQKNPIKLFFAIPDHPWTDETEGAAVRIALTAAESETSKVVKLPRLGTVSSEIQGETPEESAEQIEIYWRNCGQILSNLRSGADITKVRGLRANENLVSRGVMSGSEGFQVEQNQTELVEVKLLKKYINGRDLLQKSRNILIVDTAKLNEDELKNNYPKTYQYLLERVKPERLTNNDPKLRSEWWLYRRANTILRSALQNISSYIVTVETSKHRTFLLLESDVLPDNKLVAIALEDAYFLGVLSSQIHGTWALVCGSQLGPTPVYAKTICFDPFPFPTPTPEQEQKIRELGDRLDSHRKRIQSQHPDVTITAMYNLLEKIRAGIELTDKDREFNNKALVSTLKQIHDELDAAVLDAYEWEDLKAEGGKTKAEIEEIILERLVALNAQRSQQERNGLIRWLRPEYQAPSEVPTQQVLEGITDIAPEIITPIEQQKFPKAFKEQLAAVRDLLRTQGGEWTIDQIAAQFKSANRQKQAIALCLESLEALGIVTNHIEENRWYLAELQRAS
jgi:hypothetical protein